MPSFVLSREAEVDIAGISDYIAIRNVGAAIKMLSLLEETCQMLADNPEVGELRKGFGVPGCRSFTVGRYVVASFVRTAMESMLHEFSTQVAISSFCAAKETISIAFRPVPGDGL